MSLTWYLSINHWYGSLISSCVARHGWFVRLMRRLPKRAVWGGAKRRIAYQACTWSHGRAQSQPDAAAPTHLSPQGPGATNCDAGAGALSMRTIIRNWPADRRLNRSQGQYCLRHDWRL